MKIFYFGSVCSNETFEFVVKNSKKPPSQSAQNFESALIKGLCETDTELFVNSALSIAPFPKGCWLNIRKHSEQIEKTKTNIIPMLNLPVIKQHCMAVGLSKQLKKWLKENKDLKEKCVVSYGIYPPCAKAIQKLCKKFDCKCVAMVTDIPRMMYTYTENKKSLLKLMANRYRNLAMKLQSGFDAYIYLTEAMSDEVAKSKPYMVLETICDETVFDGIEVQKSLPKAVMYAGALYKKYGLDSIVSAFQKIECDYELWLFGDGDYVEAIKEAEKLDSRIKYFGRVDRKTILEYEKKASLLVNIRSNDEEFTKFSFPSKMVEYMLSGTPMLTSRLDGIPEEYYDYVYSAENSDTDSIALKIKEILEKENDSIGSIARDFVKDKKNAVVQAGRIMTFIKSIC